MNVRDSDLDRLLAEWLEADAMVAPAAPVEAAVDFARAHPRRRDWLAFLRRDAMTTRRTTGLRPVAILVALAALLVAAVGGAALIGSRPEATPTPMPTAAAIATPTPPPFLPAGRLEPGTYATQPFENIEFTITVPDGWEGAPKAAIQSSTGGTTAPGGAVLVLLQVHGLYSDPCQGNAGEPDVAVGPTVADLATALGNQRAYDATRPVNVNIDGYAGKQIDLQLPSDVDFASCEGGQYWVWDSAPYAQGPGNRWRLWILDIDGVRAVILAADFATTSAEDQAELRAMMESIRIDT
jgi:hypothetical protein